MNVVAFAAIAAIVATAFGVRAQSVEPPAGATPDLAAIDHQLALATQNVERLRDRSQRLAQESDGLGPRRAALGQRARAEIRFLYHLLQGQALALHGGPEAMLDQASRVARVRRSVRDTLADADRAAHRASSIAAERVQVDSDLQSEQRRRVALENQRRQTEALSGMRLSVTSAGLGPEGQVVPGTSVTVYGGAVGTTASPEASFAQSLGRLLFPVAGRAETQRVQREGADGPGLEIRTPLGTPVRGVYPGRVAFADRYGPYGRIVIVDHGEHYYSVSANLGTINVHVGEEISTGTVLGTTGDDGRGPMLYFEVRRGSETIDPAPWLGL